MFFVPLPEYFFFLVSSPLHPLDINLICPYQNFHFHLQHLAGYQAKELMKSMLKMETFFEYIERIPELPSTGHLKPTTLEGKIEFKNVCFSYPSRPNSLVLKVGLSFDVYFIISFL